MEATLLQAVAQVEETLAVLPEERVQEISQAVAPVPVEMVEMMELAVLEKLGVQKIYQWEVADQVVDLQDPKKKNLHPTAAVRELVMVTAQLKQRQTLAAVAAVVEETLTPAALLEELAQRESLQLVM
jgi:hypothetical protein